MVLYPFPQLVVFTVAGLFPAHHDTSWLSEYVILWSPAIGASVKRDPTPTFNLYSPKYGAVLPGSFKPYFLRTHPSSRDSLFETSVRVERYKGRRLSCGLYGLSRCV
jgi:hypothetical protein